MNPEIVSFLLILLAMVLIAQLFYLGSSLGDLVRRVERANSLLADISLELHKQRMDD